MKDFNGKVAFITGGGTGIGRGTAELFAREGYQVMISGRREAPLADVAGLFPDRISYMVMDLARVTDQEKTLAAIQQRYGRLDVLVNNAAQVSHGALADMSDDDISRTIDVNLTSTTLLIKRAIPLLQESGGNIINISSAAVRHVMPPTDLLAVYGASKAGLSHMTRALAPELGTLGIRINAVSPGLTRSDAAAGAINNPELLSLFLAFTPMDRVGEPVDVARVILFLAGDQAAWVTGQTIDATGGFGL